MHTVQSGQLRVFQKACSGYVRAQHAFFDQAMRVIAKHRDDLSYLPVFTEYDARFRRVEIHSAATISYGS